MAEVIVYPLKIEPARHRIFRLQMAAFALLLGLLIAWAYALQRRQLLDQVKRELTSIAHHLTFSVEHENGLPEFEESIYLAYRADRVELGLHSAVQWLDVQGRVVRSRGSLTIAPRPPGIDLLEYQHQPIPAYVYTLQARSEGKLVGYARVAISLVPIREQLQRSLLSLLALAGGLLLFSGILIWWWTGRVLRPLQSAHQELATFAGAVAHELRSPLTAIRLNSESLCKRWRDLPGDELDLALAELSQTSIEMGLVVDDILLLSQLRREVAPPQGASLNLTSLLLESVEALNGVANKRQVTLLSRVHTLEPISVYADERHLKIILRNLIENAVQYTDAGGRVEVQLVPGRLTVTDTGIGMSPAEVARACEPFWRAEPSRARHLGGAGLGLAIVSALARLHGFELRVNSQPGKGSCISLLF